jgi:hypothetical protein
VFTGTGRNSVPNLFFWGVEEKQNGRVAAGQSKFLMKSYTPECAKIEQFAATLAPLKTYLLCVQDFDTKDYTLGFSGRSITITQQQFDEGMWQDIVRIALQ